MNGRPRIVQRITGFVLAAGASILFSTPILAFAEPAAVDQDLRKLSIEELMAIEVQTVTSASKYQQKVSEAPSSVSLVTSEDIKKYGYRTLADILKSVRGFYVTYDRNYSYLGVRGFGRPGDFNTRVLLMVDGHRVNDIIYDTAAIGTDFILDVDLIDRVEISRGPGSSLYGNNAFFAVINVVTRRGRNLDGGEVSGEAGSFNTYKGRMSYGKAAQSGTEAIVSASAFYSKGGRHYFPEYDQQNPFADLRAGNNGIADGVDYDRYQSAFTKISLSRFTLVGAFIDRTKGIPTASYGTDFNDPGNLTTDRRGYVDAQYDHPLGSRSNVVARIYHDYYRYEGDYLYSGVVNRDWSYGTWQGGELRLGTRLCSSHRVMLGAEYQGNQRQDQRNADLNPSAVYLDDQRRSRTWAAYIQDEITLSPSFLLNAGVRYDHSSTFGSTMNPRLAAIISTGGNGTIKALYGSAFRAPNVYERYYAVPVSAPPMLPNPSLNPEKITTYELVYEQELGSGLRATVDGYFYQVKNLINQTIDSGDNLVYQNIEEAEGRGVELDVSKRWSGGADARLSYVMQQAVDAQTRVLLTNSPERLAKFNLALPFLDGRLVAGIEEQYTDRRTTLSGRYADDFFTTNLTLRGLSASRNLDMSLSVYNLFNTKYDDPVSGDMFPLDTVSQDGRTVRVKVTYGF